MEKNVKTEIELSEEHLQEITGGCAQCLADLRTAAHLQNRARGSIEGANAAAQIGKIGGNTGALALHNRAQTYMQQARNLLGRVRTRHEPVPDLNHPPQ